MFNCTGKCMFSKIFAGQQSQCADLWCSDLVSCTHMILYNSKTYHSHVLKSAAFLQTFFLFRFRLKTNYQFASETNNSNMTVNCTQADRKGSITPKCNKYEPSKGTLEPIKYSSDCRLPNLVKLCNYVLIGFVLLVCLINGCSTTSFGCSSNPCIFGVCIDDLNRWWNLPGSF